jgi:hypothetical protein
MKVPLLMVMMVSMNSWLLQERVARKISGDGDCEGLRCAILDDVNVDVLYNFYTCRLIFMHMLDVLYVRRIMMLMIFFFSLCA